MRIEYKNKIILVTITIIVIAITIFLLMNFLNQDDNNREKTVGFFLSKVGLVNGRHTPNVVKYLFKNNKPLYKEWSAMYYPKSVPYDVALVRVKFNKQERLERGCFIKEIKTKKDWEKVKIKYGFKKEVFGE